MNTLALLARRVAVDRRGGGKQSGGKEKRKAQRVEKSRVEVIVRNPCSVTKRAQRTGNCPNQMD